MEENTNNTYSAPDSEERGSAEGFKYCTRCGRRLPADAAYCDGCGHMQGGTSPKPSFNASYHQEKSYRPEKVSDIIGKERRYYNEKFSIINETGSSACWNWYACLGWYWFAYRKMPIEAAACFGIYLLFGLFPYIGTVLRLLLLRACGIFGNFIYLKHVQRTIDRIDLMPAELRSRAVKEYGGVSGILLIIAFLISGALIGSMNILDAIIWPGGNPLWYLHRIF